MYLLIFLLLKSFVQNNLYPIYPRKEQQYKLLKLKNNNLFEHQRNIEISISFYVTLLICTPT